MPNEDHALLPCPLPWCAGQANMIGFGVSLFAVVCRRCGLEGPKEHERDDAVIAWNTRAALSATPTQESAADAEARIMQEYRWGNLTKLGVANHLRRAGFKQTVAVDKANALTPTPAPIDNEALVEEAIGALEKIAETPNNGWMIARATLAKLKEGRAG